MSILPNLLSISRFFLAFFLFSHVTWVRLLAISLAAATDFLDGYLARRFGWVSKWGTTLDPLCDKFFVIIGLYVFLQEGALTVAEAFLMLSRDMAVVIFGFFLFFIGKLKKYSIHAIIFGKVTTAIQLIVFSCFAWEILVPFSVFVLFGLLGVLSLFELAFDDFFMRQDPSLK